jgi:hypothetical protein
MMFLIPQRPMHLCPVNKFNQINYLKMKSSTIIVLLSVAFGFLTSVGAKAQGLKQKLTERISVSFPAEYKTQEMGPTKLYNLRMADSTANFVAIVSNLQESNGFDAATLVAASLEPEFWDQAANGFLAQMGEGASLKGREMKNIKGYDIMELTIERPTTKGSPNNTVTVYIFVDDVYSINIAHTNRGGKADENKRKAFFDSLVIND